MANPRYMNSKFDSKCSDPRCKGHIAQGDRIYYMGRSKALCSRCMPAETKAAPAVNDWASALAWDDSDPVPGASIGADNTTAVAEAIKLRESVKRPAAEVVSIAPPTDDQLADTGQQIIEQAKAKAEPPAVDLNAFEFSDDERAEALTSELLIILVNAIDVAGLTGRHTLATYCREQAKRALDMSSRQHIWTGIAQAIDRA